MQRYFTNNIPNNNIIEINGDDYFHITRVMRMVKGDKVYICSNNETYLAELLIFKDTGVLFMILEKLDEKKELPYQVTIAHGLVRKEKMEEVIEKITALGATSYLPVDMERSNAKFQDDKKDKKLVRLNKIAKEAAEQSHRTSIMTVLEPVSFKELLKKSNEYDLLLVAYENTNPNETLKKVIKSCDYQNVLILIGPEGGITDKELKSLEENKYKKISLGPRILRTELAPVYIMSVLGYEWDDENEI